MSEVNSGLVILDKQDSVTTVIMNRPEKTNALSPELMRELGEALRSIASDPSVRAVVLTGAGRSFSAGGDIKKDIEPLGTMSQAEFDDFFGMVDSLYLSIIDMPKPVIAAVNGYAMAGGLELALCCDIRVVSEDAKLGAIFVRMGLCPEVGLYLLPRLVGTGKAKLMAFTGDIVGAQDALQMGLVEMVVPADKLLSAAQELAGRLARGPGAIASIKRAMHDSFNMDLLSFMTYSKLLTYQLAHSEDHREALSAFRDKRTPKFRGR